MAGVTLDAGALIGLDRDDRRIVVLLARARETGVADGVVFKQLSSLEVEDAFPVGSFDVVIASLLLSELSDAEADCTLAQCRRVIDAGGTLIVVDELDAEGAVARVVNAMVRIPVRFVGYLIAHIVRKPWIRGVSIVIAFVPFVITNFLFNV